MLTAYDPATGKASSQRVEATTIHHDANPVDITLQVREAVSATPGGKTAGKTAAKPAKPATTTTTHTEVVHTTANHPQFSDEHGWLIASFLQVGEPVVRADGSTATVVAVHSVAGANEPLRRSFIRKSSIVGRPIRRHGTVYCAV